jgi:hypothetical protein
MWAPGRERRRAREKKTKVADRPHWITIAIGIAGPLLTVLAVTVAYLNLRLQLESREDAVRRARAEARAALRVANEAATITERSVYDMLTNSETHVVDVRYSFAVQNGGKSAGLIDTLRVTFVVLDEKNWRFESNEDKPTTQWERLAVRAGDSIPFSDVRPFKSRLRLPDNREQRVNPIGIQMHGTLQYRDIYSEAHLETWCWDVVFRPNALVPCAPQIRLLPRAIGINLYRTLQILSGSL